MSILKQLFKNQKMAFGGLLIAIPMLIYTLYDFVPIVFGIVAIATLALLWAIGESLIKLIKERKNAGK